MPGNTRDLNKHSPVSILAKNDSATREITAYKGNLANYENGKSQRSPNYRPIEDTTYVNPQKLQIVTSGNRRNKENGRATESFEMGGGSDDFKSPTSALATGVSFTMADIADKISHRGSISARPSSVALTAQGGTGSAPPGLEGRQNSVVGAHFESSAASSRQNSVHMPGEYIFMDCPPQNVPQSHSPSNNSSGNRKQQHHVNKALIEAQLGPQLPFTEFFQKQDDKKIHILIGATGSVATIKVPVIIDKLYKVYGPDNVSIQLVLTKPAEHFLRGLKISTDVKIWRDEDEWCGFKRMGDPMLHTELRRWADVCLLAPLSANTLAKLAYGICDNLLTSLLRCWTPSTPVLVAPAMNTFMYTHPVTKKHLMMLQEESPHITILKPVEKVLVCGDIGMGGMRDWHDIVDILTKKVAEIRGNVDEDSADDEDDDDEEEEGDTNMPDETDSDDSGVDGGDDDDDDEVDGEVGNSDENKYQKKNDKGKCIGGISSKNEVLRDGVDRDVLTKRL
ncbi:LAME_0E00826g1_1 [Lachancea meyersii CBS 8951]|uniref:LAME_0E00826g1_1 n=1 Tax=Lachancea meyersii CBS 8951 TaxID=1266667 RepID=A0A1G4JEP1_9SACH|nr:LAME_0E00826g1_1 [Lachancea meyersii CBS 8951]